MERKLYKNCVIGLVLTTIVILGETGIELLNTDFLVIKTLEDKFASISFKVVVFLEILIWFWELTLIIALNLYCKLAHTIIRPNWLTKGLALIIRGRTWLVRIIFFNSFLNIIYACIIIKIMDMAENKTILVLSVSLIIILFPC